MKHFESIAATAFGLVFLVLAVAVAIETGARKLLNVSLQGVDELGGYCLAIGGALAFAVSLVSRAHIRIDIVHEYLPRILRAGLNLLAALALFVCALVLLYLAWVSLSDSILFGSTAQTPWATPLRHPQSLWVAALAVFALLATLQLARVLALAAGGRLDVLDGEYGPRGSKEELAEEIQDIKQRGAAAIDLEESVKT
jgi:TRAP-type C4-dicarboxylate transport system permease small subunit